MATELLALVGVTLYGNAAMPGAPVRPLLIVSVAAAFLGIAKKTT